MTRTPDSNQYVLASSNPKKVAELSRYLPGGVTVVNQDELGIASPAETGTTFVENAIIKARNAALHSGLPAIADDSGLEVDALQGAPGVYSARYAGTGASDQDNNAKLLEAMENIADADRGARFWSVIVLMRHASDPVPVITTGSWEGRILRAPRGAGGFGYDPLFVDPNLDRAAAELSPAEKHAVSHRGKALRALQQAIAPPSDQH